ncbi:MAG TPA: hypothetical protein VHP61_07340, partial [Acidobacteriota bacterium]|nr:hypothetical protein [Acidobacteriota bacterium]
WTATAHHLVTNTGWTPVIFAVACGLGSMIWYLLLVRYVAKHQQKIKPSAIRRLLLFMGIGLIAFGLYTFARIFV